MMPKKNRVSPFFCKIAPGGTVNKVFDKKAKKVNRTTFTAGAFLSCKQ